MNILTSLTKKYLILNKKRTIVTIVGIILSCALIGAVANLLTSFQHFMINISIEDYGAQHAIYEKVPIEKLKYIEHNANIKDTLLVYDIGNILIDNPKSENKPFISITALNNSFFSAKKLKLLEGRLPKNSNEIIINESLLKDENLKYKVGDKIDFNIGTRILKGESLFSGSYYPSYDEEGNKETYIENSTKTYQIVGIIENKKINSVFSSSYESYTYLDNNLINSIDYINAYVISKNIKTCYEDINKIANDLKLTKVTFNDELLRWYGVTGHDNTNQVLYTIGTILAVVIMIASIIVIYNSFTISITERKKQFGMLSSIGTTSKQLRSMVIKEGLFLSVIGIPLGILLSIVGIGITLIVVNNLGIFSDYYTSRLHLVISTQAVFLAIVLEIITVFLSSLIPAIKVSRTSPIDAIRLSSDIKIKGRKVKTSKLSRMLFGIEGELGLKNMKRNKKKYRSTIISLFVSIVLFMTISAFANYSFKSALKLYKNYNYDLIVYSNNDDNLNDLYKKASKLNNIDNYSIVRNLYLMTSIDKDKINKEVIDKLDCNNDTNKCSIGVNLSTLGDREFKSFINKNKLKYSDYVNINDYKVIFLEKSIYADYAHNQMYEISLLKNKVGEKLDLYYQQDDNKILTNSIEIGKYTNLYPIGFTTDNIPMGSVQGFISDELYDTFPSEAKKDNYMFISSSKADELEKEINKLAEKDNLKISIANINSMAKQLKNIILALDIFLYGFIILVALITVTNIINTITTSIYLRRREFAMIKAVGMTNKSFNKMIAYESIFYGIKGAIYGVIVGTFLDYFLYQNIKSAFIYDYQIPYKTIIISIIFVFIIIFITMIYAVRKIRNDNIVDVIKQENL